MRGRLRRRDGSHQPQLWRLALRLRFNLPSAPDAIQLSAAQAHSPGTVGPRRQAREHVFDILPSGTYTANPTRRTHHKLPKYVTSPLAFLFGSVPMVGRTRRLVHARPVALVAAISMHGPWQTHT